MKHLSICCVLNTAKEKKRNTAYNVIRKMKFLVNVESVENDAG